MFLKNVFFIKTEKLFNNQAKSYVLLCLVGTKMCKFVGKIELCC